MDSTHLTTGYKEQLSEKYNKKIKNLLEEMPDFCKSYELFLRNKNSLKTRTEYLIDIHNFFRYLTIKNPSIKVTKDVSTETLGSLNGFDFDEYLAWLSSYKFDENNEKEMRKENGAISKRRKLAAIKSLYHFLYTREYISCNPTEKAVSPTTKRAKRSSINVLEKNEVASLFSSISEELKNAQEALLSKSDDKTTIRDRMRPYLAIRDRAIVSLFLGTGLRVSELCAIDISDISFDMGYINVVRKGDGDEFGTSDQVYMSKDVAHALSEYLNHARENIGATPEHYNALFLSAKHSRITPRGVELMVKKYANDAFGTGNNVHPHTLRATFGTNYYEMTKDISATSTAMNHSGIEVTAKYYVREDKNAKKAVQNMKLI